MKEMFEGLNKAQINAVRTTEGPVMAIAGAGSGKTRVLTRRMAHLIFNLGVPRQSILAITFTNKAAEEMKMRVGSLLNVSTRDMWVSTFHSMCARILREHIERLGYNQNFQIIDDDDATQLIKLILRRLNIDVKLVKPRMLKSLVMNVKGDLDAIDAYEEPIQTYLRNVVPEYQRHLKANNLVDFEDLLVLTIELLEQHKTVREYYQNQFQYILVDEFQDTNNLQYRLIRLLVGKHQNVFIVGDEDQSIYAFRGANIENIQRFQQDFTNVKPILLEQNYRSTNNILNAANGVIKSNKTRIDKTLFSTRGDGDKVTFFKAYTYRDEAAYVAETIKEYARKTDIDFSDIAVLYRANSTSRTFEESFIHKNIPYQIVGNTAFFRRKEIKDVVAYLRLTLNPHDDYSFSRVVNEPRRGIGAKTIDRLMLHAEREQQSLFDAVDDEDTPLGKTATNRLRAFKQLIRTLSENLKTLDLGDFLEFLLAETGYKEALKFDDMGEVRLENVLELKSMFVEQKRAVADSDNTVLLTAVLQDIALQSQEDERHDKNAVTLMTLHAAKGLEYKVVFIVALEQGLFPLHRALDSAKDMEEERRLMYVGMTRAMDKLFLTNARQRRLFGQMMMNPDSQFLREIDPTLLSVEGLNKPTFHTPSRQAFPKHAMLDTNDEQENAIQKGDKVRHKAFGKGLVVSVDGDQAVIVFDQPHGIKTLLKNHRAIEKV